MTHQLGPGTHPQADGRSRGRMRCMLAADDRRYPAHPLRRATKKPWSSDQGFFMTHQLGPGTHPQAVKAKAHLPRSPTVNNQRFARSPYRCI